jgi:WD40 repeat protein
VQRFDLPNGPASTLEVRHTAAVRAVVEVPGAEAPGRLRVLTAGDDGQVRAQRWNGEVDSLDDLHARVLALAVSADGQRAAWSADDGALVLYSLEFGKEIWRGKDVVTRALAFSPDGRVLALGRDDKRLALRSAETGALELEADPFDAAVTVLSWASADEVAVGRADGTLSAYSRAGKRVTTQWSGLPRVRVTALTVRDGHVLAGTDDGQAFTWEVEGGAPLLQLTSDSGTVGAVDLVDGVLIYGGTDRVVHALTLAGHHETR